MLRYLMIVMSFIGLTNTAGANVTLPAIFADNMVLQRNIPIPVWGHAAANEKIEIRFNKQVKSVKADKNGRWIIKLDMEIAGGPFDLLIRGKNTIQFKNVLVGDVWICSGQSNMEWNVGQSANAAEEVAGADFPLIRQVKIAKTVNSLPQDDFQTSGWMICDPSTVPAFTGVGYFFARQIYKELNIPIGIINDSWGGTNIETWIGREGFENSDEFKGMIAGVPVVNLDSMARLRIQAVAARVDLLQGTKVGSVNPESFKLADFDDSKWPVMNQPMGWEQQALGELDGVVWLRKTIDLTPEQSRADATLSLTKIDDDDITYVNNVKVGSTNQWDALRKYKIPAGVLKPGKNVIAVRVTDNGGGGGIYGNAADLKLILGENSISLQGEWKYQVESIKKNTNENALPSLVFNTMINPLIPYAFKGVLWYQGEANASRSWQYRKAFPLLIQNWRQRWGQGDFPFYFVQLATFRTSGNSNEGCGWAELREAQTLTLKVPNTGMCVTTDVGNPNDIHPVNKQTVGKRLAAIALRNLYDRQVVCNGPMYQSMEIKGNTIELTFSETGSGLITPDKYGYLKGFEIAGADQVFYYAKAAISNNKVVVTCDKVPSPAAVRFGWVGDASDNNLFNQEGFPAVPFRTDDWKMVTKDAKYVVEKMN